MKKYIVTTTINDPTIATLKYCEIAKRKDWTFVIIGDKKTNHTKYFELENDSVIYLSPERQEELFPKLSEVIGWNTIQRRNIGFVYSFKEGAEIVATVDDDNIPYETWGDDVYVGQEIQVDLYENIYNDVFDPLSVTTHNYLWHRGYPIELIEKKNEVVYKGKITKKVLIQSDFWDGDPDIDAICRLSKKPTVKFEDFQPFSTNQLTPFNSQNTFLHRSVLPYYSVLPYVGRMDDIWGGFITQLFFPNSVIYSKATVYQDRNKQDLIKNLEDEIFGYRKSMTLINSLENFLSILPEETVTFWKEYQKNFL